MTVAKATENHELKKKIMAPFLWMGFSCLKATGYEETVYFYLSQRPGDVGTHLINLRRIKDRVDLS